MPGLYIFTSNRLEILAEQLARIIRTPLLPPLTAETIVVQSQGMERWISMVLAADNGVSANCSFPFPNAFLEDVFRQIMPDLPEVSPFDPAIMQFRLMRIIPGCLSRNGFEHLKTYLTDDNRQLKLFQLAGKIADLFDQYLVFRPELIFQWEAQKEEKKPPHVWQARLWRELAAGNEHRHRAWLQKKLIEKIRAGALDTVDLPKRISIFGISYLPRFHLQAFAELSKLMEINFFLIDPCREYWADIVSDQEIKKIRRKYPRVAENIERYHFEKGNRLLASMGTLGRNFFDLITGFDCEVCEEFIEPQESRVLTVLQSDILNLRDRDGSETDRTLDPSSRVQPPYEIQAGRLRLSAGDTSLQVNSCHSPMREIEVLHDNLLAMFEDDPDLLPKDIIVMTPDIETYAPYVQAVFGAQIDEALRIPFNIADRSPRRESSMIDGFLSLLELRDSRFGAAQVVKLLEFPGIKERFNLVDADLPVIDRWVRTTNIRWGIDAKSRLEAGLPGYSENSWRAGLDRLILGYALPGANKIMFEGILPFDHIEGSQVQILGRFLEFVDRIFACAQSLTESRRLGEWRHRLLMLLEEFFRPDDNIEREMQLLRQALDDLAAKETAANYHDKIEPEVIGSYLKSLLEQNRYGSGFLSGGVTFCAMLPMRSIPFKVICLIGMNDDGFPRDYPPLNFDLMARHPQSGDRSPRNDDKYLFLESIISARQKLYISYVGQSIQDNSPVPPSVLVSELLDTISGSFESEDKPILEHIVTTHRLQQFSSRYFREGTGLFSYSSENMLAAAGASEKTALPPFFTTRIALAPEGVEAWQRVDLDSLCLFFGNPAMFLLQRRLGLRLEDDVLLTAERENFELDPLQRYLVEQNLFQALIEGNTPEAFKPIQKAIGQLPPGNVGECLYREMSIDAQTFVSRVVKFTGTISSTAIKVDLEINGFHLEGRLSSVSDSGYVHVRYGRQRAKDLLRVWIYHLVYCHAAPADFQRSSYLICKESALQFEPVSDSLPILEDLLALFRQGLGVPIHFFPNSSFEYAEQLLRKSAPESTALSRAARIWIGSDFGKYARGESSDPYYDLCFRRSDPLDSDFQFNAVRIFKPLLDNSREIVI